MRFNCMLACAAGAAALSLTGCVDDNYDLSDIDTTVRVEVSDLVVPVNLDRITLNSVFDLEDDGIVRIVNNEYAVVKDGTISSAGISVDAFAIPAPSVPVTSTTVYPASVSLPAGSFAFDVETPPSAFAFRSEPVSSDVLALTSVSGNLEIAMSMTINNGSPLPGSVSASDLVVQLPKGLVLSDAGGGDYDIASGEMSFSSIPAAGGKITIRIVANEIVLSYYGADAFNASTRIVSLSGNVCVKSGRLVISGIPAGSRAPASVSVKTACNFSALRAEAFSGEITHAISSVSIPDVVISDLPDILSQPGTDITLANPCIYLKVNNPLEEYSLYYRTGFSVSAWRGETVSGPYSLDNGTFDLCRDNRAGFWSYCLSPEMPQPPVDGFADAIHVPFTSLSDVLSGNGLPSRLSISLDGLQVPPQPVTRFTFGNYGGVEGQYSFVAPIRFGGQSKIVYTDQIDGWNSEDLDYLTITRLEVSVTVNTDVPMSLDFTGYPIDVDGNRINGVAIEGATVSANASDQKVTIRITGEVSRLDGIRFTATASAVDGAPALAPDMNITLSDIRPCVSGYYQKEL